jgi:hypothetical protein
MTSNVPPGGGSGVPPYRPEFRVSPQFRKFWEQLFRNAPLTNEQVSQMTDQFVKMTWNQMNQVLQWALQQEKERHRREREEGN